jgi:hypothetical protein
MPYPVFMAKINCVPDPLHVWSARSYAGSAGRSPPWYGRYTRCVTVYVPALRPVRVIVVPTGRLAQNA